jgi:hypothetical protein
MGTFITKEEFIEQTGFIEANIGTDNINDALELSATKLKQSLFVKKKYEFTTPDDKFKLETPLADYNGDNTIDEDDINIYELDEDDYTETDRNTNILNFKEKYGYIIMDALYPTNNRKLIIESYIARFDNDEMQQYIKRLMILLASQYLFNTISISKLQEGISSWNLNGVSVTFDQSSINTIKEEIKKEIIQIYNYCKPILEFKTNFGFGNDDRNRWGFDLRTPGGNRYRRI